MNDISTSTTGLFSAPPHDEMFLLCALTKTRGGKRDEAQSFQGIFHTCLIAIKAIASAVIKWALH